MNIIYKYCTVSRISDTRFKTLTKLGMQENYNGFYFEPLCAKQDTLSGT